MSTALRTIMGLGLAFLAAGCTKAASQSPGCTSGQAECNGVCIDVLGDSQNCGMCGFACSAGTSCQAGECACAAGLVECSGACVSSNTDHCGSSCAVCASGGVCNDGQCLSSCP